MVKHIIIFIYFFIFYFSSQAKNSGEFTTVDSLISALKLKLNQHKSKGDYSFALMSVKLSELYNRKNLPDSAFATVERSLMSLKKNSVNEKVLLLSEKASCYAKIGRNDKAMEYFHYADLLLNEVSSPCTRIYHSLNKAEFYRKIVKFQLAKKELGQVKHLLNNGELCDSALLVSYYHRTAAIMDEGGGDSVIYYSLKSIALSQRLMDYFSEATSLNELGFYWKNRLLVDSSMTFYLLAEKKWKQYGSLSNAAHAMFNRAQLISHNNLSKKQSNLILKEIISMQEAKLIDYPIDNVYDLIRDNYFFMGDSTNFIKYKILALQARMYANVKRHEADIRKLTERYKNDSIRSQVNLVSEKLKITEGDLKMKDRENKRAYLFLTLLVLLLSIIGFLLYRLFISNKSLKEKFKEKEALVQEIHHRVKNNLQFVSSIINMQTNSIENKSDAILLKDTSRRIRSMALVHELLYNKDEERGVNMKDYLNELVQNIDDLVNSSGQKIDFSLAVDPLIFDVSKATAIGMIVSELTSNSLKYAFAKVESPLIKIVLRLKGTLDYELIYSDNGIGLPETYNSNNNKLGMRLIDIFSRQIKGTYVFENQNGLIYRINFNKNESYT